MFEPVCQSRQRRFGRFEYGFGIAHIGRRTHEGRVTTA